MLCIAIIGRAELVDLSARFFGIIISSVRRRLNAHALHRRCGNPNEDSVQQKLETLAPQYVAEGFSKLTPNERYINPE